ncbi:MAG: DUF3574 domain-containing protein [Alphaproteobacteria bacterium]|nr:DUF3574 domain-containing protein [Alphaproteobacteria bacterium]
MSLHPGKAACVAALAFLLASCASAPPPSTCVAPLKVATQVDLYFGRGTATGEVSASEWAEFLTGEITPRFPDGLSVIDVSGQYRDPSGRIGREHSKLVTILVFDPPAHTPKVKAIVDTYKKRYAQHSVLHTERTMCAGL